MGAGSWPDLMTDLSEPLGGKFRDVATTNEANELGHHLEAVPKASYPFVEATQLDWFTTKRGPSHSLQFVSS